MRRLVCLFLVLLPIILMAGCGGGPGGGGSAPDFAHLDITGAKALAIVPTSSLTRSQLRAGTDRADSPSNTLVKIDATGMVVETTLTDENGNTITQTNSFAPLSLADINETYVMVSFGVQIGASAREIAYLIRKTDGAVFSLENVGPPCNNNYYLNESEVFADGAGNIYYMVETSWVKRLYKITIDPLNPDNLTAQQISAPDDGLNYFAVDDAGNVLYKNDENITRLRYSDGGYFILNIDNFWVAPDGNFYYSSKGTIQKLIISGHDVGYENYGTNNDIYVNNYPDQFYAFKTTNTMLLVSTYGSNFFEVYNSTGNPRAISDLPYLKNTNIVMASPNYYYFGGFYDEGVTQKYRLLKITPGTYGYTDLIDNGAYEIRQMAVASDDVITFSALRTTDAKKVMGEISAAGNIIITDQSGEAEIISIVRIL